MANKQIQGSHQVHGTNPQFLLDTIIRQKIYSNQYWKEQLFAVNAETLVDKSISIDHIGGTYSGVRKPTKFLCLVLKMLQLQPEKEIVMAFIQNEDYKYSTALGLFYLRLTGKPDEIFQILEQFYSDNRKLILRQADGQYKIQHVDEFVDDLLHEEIVFDIVLPRLPKRINLEESGELQPRVSPLEKDLEKELQDMYNQEQEAEDAKRKQLLESKEEENGEKQNKIDEDSQSESGDEKKKRKKDKKKHKHRSHQSRSRSRERKKWRKVVNKKEKERHHHKSRSKSRSKSNDKYKKDKQDQNNKNNNNKYQQSEKEPEEGSVEYWNKIRAGLGMKLIQQ